MNILEILGAKYDKAISGYTKAIEINPLDAKAYYDRGVAYNDKGLYEKDFYDKAISDFTMAGDLFGKTGNTEMAIKCYNTAKELINMKQYNHAVACTNEAIVEFTTVGDFFKKIGNTEMATKCYSAVQKLKNIK